MANIQNNKLELLPHQEEAYQDVEKLFEEKGKAAVIFPTGCGKSFVLLKYILEHPDERILFLSPRHAIKDQMYEYIVRFIGGDSRPIEEIQKESGSLKQAAKQYIPNIECMLYQTIMGIGEKDSVDELIESLKLDIVIVDEMHHLKTKSMREARNQVLDDKEDTSEEIFDEDEEDEIENEENLNKENKWGQKFHKLLEMNPQAKLLGLSATPIRNDGANVVERIFNDAIASEISLLEAIEAGIIYPPKYVVPDFIREEELKSLLEKIETAEDSEKEKLKAEYDNLVKKSTQAPGIPDLLSENITELDGKYIIFCKNIEDMQEKMSKAQEWFRKIDEEPEIYGIHSKDSASAKKLESFNNSKSKHLKLMYCVGMIDEGVHLTDVSGVILAAKTGSRPTYFQRIGRAISSGKDKKQATVIDLVNNNEILQGEQNIQYGYEINDIEALEKLIEWIEEKNNGKLPEYSKDKSSKERAMARRLVRINNKYLKYVNNPDLLETLSKDKQDEVQEIIELGNKIGIFKDVMKIDSEDKETRKIDTSIEIFLKNIEIKGVRKDFRELLNNEAFTKNTNMRNLEEYIAWCEENGRLPRTNIKNVKSAKDGEKETKEQREQRLGKARQTFYMSIKGKQDLTEEEEEIKREYEELDKTYREKSAHMQNLEEYIAWREENGRLPRTNIKNVKSAKDGEKETKEQKERRLGLARKTFYRTIKGKQDLTEEEKEIKRIYEELDKKYREKSAHMQHLEEYIAWCEENGRLPRTGMKGVKSAKDGEKETEEQREQRLGMARQRFYVAIKGKQDLTEEEKEIKRLYEELDKKYREKSANMRNLEEYIAWCEENGRLPRTGIKGVKSAKDGEKETKEQRLGKARQRFYVAIKGKQDLTEEEEEIKREYEELDKTYREKSANMRNLEEYIAWCKENGMLPRANIKNVKSAKDGERETEEQREQRLGKARRSFYRYIEGKQDLTEEEGEIKSKYEELDEEYKRKRSARKLAETIKNVPIEEAQEASEFLGIITNEKGKEGVIRSDE